MPLLPNESAVESAIGEALVMAFADQPDVAAALADSSIYFGPNNDPRAPRPACRISETSQVSLGREKLVAIPQTQLWLVELLAVAPGPYTIVVKGTPRTYTAQLADDAAAIVVGLVTALAADPNAAGAAVPSEPALEVEAAAPGVHLALAVTSNMVAAVTRDRAYRQGGTAAERTLSFQFASVMDPGSPSPRQHALTYAKLWRGRVWHSDVLARLAVAGIAPRRIASGPTDVSVLIDNVTETRAVLEVVFSITAGAASLTPVMESASVSTTLQE